MNHLKTYFTTLILVVSLGAQQVPKRAGSSLIKQTSASDDVISDRADSRREFNLWWFGGEPSATYLDYKKALAKQEQKRWAYTFPGYQGDASAIPTASSTWINLGPKNSSYSSYSGSTPAHSDVDAGRLAELGILTHPTNPQILYVATSGGGLWKTTNADLTTSGDWTWTPLSDSLPNATTTGNVSIGAVAMSPVDPETLFLALGDSFDAAGRGFYKSVNGGATWNELGTVGPVTRVHSLLVLDANTILVGGDTGMWRSTNGGASFTVVDIGGYKGGQIWSIQRVGSSTTNLVATRQYAPGGPFYYSGTFWYSSDAGATWSQATLDGLALAQNAGRITVNSSLSNATVVYAIAENTVSNVFAKGVFKSIDAGHTWTFLAAPVVSGGLFQPFDDLGDGGQSEYNHFLAVDPDDASNLFVAATLCLYRSMDGGANWTQLTSWKSRHLPYCHADFHTNAWSKTGPKTLFVGNDGGLSVMRDPFRPTPPFTSDPTIYAAGDLTFVDNRRNRGIASQLIFNVGSSIATFPADTRYRSTLGMQDLGTRIRVNEGSGIENSSTWNDTGGGDGLGTLINSANGDKMMKSIQYTYIHRSIDGGTTWDPAISGITGPKPFDTLLIPGRADVTGNTLFTRTKAIIFKSTDWAASDWMPLPMSGFSGTAIRTFNTSASNGNAMVIGAEDGKIWVSSNGGSTWTNPAGSSLTGGASTLSYVWFDTADDQVIYAASVALTTGSHLWKSVNGGNNFTPIDIANGFPFGIPVYIIQNDPSTPNRLLAGTDFGVYLSENGGTTWTRYGVGLPMVATRDLYVAPDGSFVRAATFGRGVWEIGGSVTLSPTITTQPQNQTVTAGQTATFNVMATGTLPFSFQWKKNGVNIVGATGNPYTTPSTLIGENGTLFSVIVTNNIGSVTSNNAMLTVNPAPIAPSITSQPASVAVTAGATATFNVTASGTAALTYQWRKNSVNISGATAASYTTPATTVSDNGAAFSVVASNIAGSATSTNATLTVNPAPIAPTITGQPASVAVTAGTIATFNVTASGTAPLTYQWRRNAVNIPGATATSYTTPATAISDNGAAFSVVVTNIAGTTTSNNATLTVNTAPAISQQPQPQSITAGQTVVFNVVATGTGPMSYQWRKNSVDIPGASSSTFAFVAKLSDSGAQFLVSVSNAVGSVVSVNAALTVVPKNRDLNGDAQVNVLDLATFMAAYSGSGIPTNNPSADLDGDGDCDDVDLALLLAGI